MVSYMLRSALSIATFAAMSGTATAAIVFDAGIDDVGSGRNGPRFINSIGDSLSAFGNNVRLALHSNSTEETFIFDTQFLGDGTISNYQSIDLGGGQTLHTYSFDGQFSFRPTGTLEDILTIDITNGVFTALGTADSWGASSSIQGSTTAGSEITYTWSGDAIADLGLEPGTLLGDSSFAFGNTEEIGGQSGDTGDPGVSLGADGLPDERWTADTVFSGYSANIPAPGSLALLIAAGAITARRRR